MAVDTKRKKNQKKKLKQKEKKAAAGKEVTVVADENELDKAIDQSTPIIVDRVAAEEVIPPHVSRERKEEMFSQNEVDRTGSPQLAPEPMGQAAEATPEFDYDEFVPRQRYDESRDTNNDDYKEEAVEECDELPPSHIPSHRHHRSASASAAAAPHLSEDTSENDVLPEGSIERRVSLQMKRASITGMKPDEAKISSPRKGSSQSMESEGSSDGSVIHFNLPSGQDSQTQSSFPFPSKRHSVEQSVSPDEVPQQSKDAEGEEGSAPAIQNQKATDQETNGDDQQESLNTTESSRRGTQADEENLEIQGSENQKIGNSTENENENEGSDHPMGNIKPGSASEPSDKNEASQQPEISTIGINKETDNNNNSTQIDELFSGADTGENQESMPWETSESVDAASKDALPLRDNEQNEELKSFIPQQHSADNQEEENKQLTTHEQPSANDVVQDAKVFEDNHSESVSREPDHDFSNSVAQINEAALSSDALSSERLASIENADHKSVTSNEKPPVSDKQLDELFGDSEGSGGEKMPWEASQSNEHILESPETTAQKETGLESAANQELQQNNTENTNVSEEEERKEVDKLFNEPDDEKRELMPWEISDANHEDTTTHDGTEKGIKKEVQQKPTVENSSESADQMNSLFGGSNEIQEPMPWETAGPDHFEIAGGSSADRIQQNDQDVQKLSDDSVQVDALFGESEHEPKPWEVSEQTQAPAQAPADHSQRQETTEPKKFSFLEDDDDLLDDDDDSYLESEEEQEAKDEQAAQTVEFPKERQNSDGQFRLRTSSATASLIGSPAYSHEAVSKYTPGNVSQIRGHNLQQNAFPTFVPPQGTRGNIGASIVPPQPQGSSAFGAQQRSAVEGQKVIEKINQEKNKSDAFDFPMDLVSKKTEKVHAKPVGVPPSRFGSPPPFELGPRASQRGSRNNSIASLPSNPYAAAANVSKTRVQSPLPPQGVVLPPNVAPLGNQLSSSSHPIPFPSSRRTSVRSQYGTTVRTRGFSNASASGPMSADASNSVPVAQGPVESASRYTPNSPLKTTVYPPVPGVTGPIANSANVPPVNVGTPVGGPYAPSKPLPMSSTLPQSVGNTSMLQSQNLPVPNTTSVAAQNASLPPYGSNIANVGASGPSDSYPPVGATANSGPPISGRGRKTANRTYAKSNSSVYTPNQNEHTSKYAPTVHPQYQHLPLPTGPSGVPHPLTSINAYMESHPQGVIGPDDSSVSRPVNNEALLQHQFPLFSWSSSEKIVYGISNEDVQGPYPIGSDLSVKEFKLVNLDTVLNSKNFLKSFPGPLIKNKCKGKDLRKWLEDHADELSRDDESSSTVLSLLKLKLTDNVNFKDISRILYNSDDLFLYLSQPVMQPTQLPNAGKLDANNQMRICAYLQTGGQQEALQLALEMKDFSMALLLGSLMGKEKWSEVVKSYLSSEIETAAGESNLTNLLSLVFQVFIGSSKTAFQEFYTNEEKAKWASENWRMVVAAVLNNVHSTPSTHGILEVPPVVAEFLVEYGIFLYRKEMKLPACILFMIANLPLSSTPVAPNIDVKFEFIGSPCSLVGMIFSEVYEFCVADTKSFPVLIPQKLYHAVCLQERGLTTAASKYTDYLSGVLRNFPKKEAFSINLNNQLNNLNASIAGASTGWLGKPKLSSVWGHLDKSFNKFIGGDDDSLMKKSSGKKVFDGFTPVSSRNNSTLDLSQTPFVPYRGHSKKPSYGQSETSVLTQVTGHSPVRNPVPIEGMYGGSGQPESYGRRASYTNSNPHDALKASQYAPPVTSNARAPLNLRRVHTTQTIGTLFPSSSGLPSEPASDITNSQEESHVSSEKVQETLDSAFLGDAKLPIKKTPYHNSTPNLLRRPSDISEASSGRKGSINVGGTPLSGKQLKETSEEGDLPPGIPHRDSGQKIVNYGHQTLSERPYLVAPPVLHGDESSPVSTVATESATEDDELNSDIEQTTLRHDQSSWAVPPPKDGPSVASSPDAIIRSSSGETLKRSEGRPPRISTYNPAAIPESVDERTPIAATRNEAGLGIRMNSAGSTSIVEGKVNPPPSVKANPYANNGPARKSFKKKSYMPKGAAETSISAVQPQGNSELDVNGLGMFVEESEVSRHLEKDKLVGSPPAFPEAFSTPSLVPANPAGGKTDLASRFDPAKEPEEVSKEMFEPVIKRTPKVRAFSPMVMQPSETQYDDIVEDESEDEDEDEFKRKKLEEEKAKKEEEEEERREEERTRKAKKEKENRDKSSSGWFSWLKKDPNEKKPIKAKLGNKKRNFYYDEKLKRWVNANATEEEKEQFSTPPPPPPVVRRMDNGPKTKPRSGSLTAPSKPAAGAVAPKNPITGEPLMSAGLPAADSHSSSEKSSTDPSSSNNSGVNLAGKKANGLDDLLNLAGGTAGSTRRKKKPGRGYVNVMGMK